jgi:hypothetical protein
VQHRPCCLVAAQPQLPLELQGREAGRLCRDQVGGPEPLRKRLPGSVQDGARGNRGLVPASLASPKQPRRQLEGFAVLAARTAEPLRPTASRQVVATRLFFAEELPKLVQRPRILPGARPTLSLGVGGVNRISRNGVTARGARGQGPGRSGMAPKPGIRPESRPRAHEGPVRVRASNDGEEDPVRPSWRWA